MTPCPGAGATFLPPKTGHIPGPDTSPGTEGRNHSCVCSVGFMPATSLRRVPLSHLRVGVSQAEPETRVLTQVDGLRATSGIPAGEGGREEDKEGNAPAQRALSSQLLSVRPPEHSPSGRLPGHAQQSYAPRGDSKLGRPPLTDSHPSLHESYSHVALFPKAAGLQ